MPEPPSFGAQVRRYRERAGLSQAALAERTQLTAKAIAALERGRRLRPYADTVRRLAQALELSVEESAAFSAAARSADEPAIAALPAAPAPLTNLPPPRTRLIGREQALATLVELVPAHAGRLVTLTGIGGTGKTRLALAVAAALRDTFPEGVWLVELAAVADPTLVPQAVATALDLPEAPGVASRDRLLAALRNRALLLVFDNCEHLINTCATLAEQVLDGCPDVTILATSREPLQLARERVWRLAPLALPNPDRPASPAELAQFPAVQLFVERARAAYAGFDLTAQNAGAIAAVCARLDGIPLAIELAAARVRVLTVAQILERLGDSLRLLTGNSRVAPTRQQTVLATFDWSYNLLAPLEQTLFRRLSVFVGGWTLEAVEAIGAGEGIDAAAVLDLLTALVDKSLVVVEQQEEGIRYRLLEPIREYALERLTAAGELSDARSKHLAYFARLVNTAEPKMEWGAEQLAWLRRVECERDNLDAALAWAAGVDAATGQQMVPALWRFWWHCGRLAQGRRWLDWALSLPSSASLRARLLQVAGQLAYWSGDMAAAEEYLEAALTIHRGGEDPAELAWTLHRLGLTLAERGDPERGLALCEESVALCRTRDDARGLAYALQSAGNVARMGGDRNRPEAYAEEALALCRASGNKLLTPYPLRQLMVVALTRGDDARARARGEEALALAREIGDPHAITAILLDLLRLARRQRKVEETAALGHEGLSVLRRVGANQYAEPMLEIMAWAAAQRGEPERAAAVLGAASALQRSSGASRDVLDRPAYDETLTGTRAALGDERFASAWARGQSLTLNAVIAEALLDPDPFVAPPRPAAPGAPQMTPELVTPREQEVACLLAEGYSDREIADALNISVRTVGSHVQHLLAKLGLRSRWQVADWTQSREADTRLG